MAFDPNNYNLLPGSDALAVAENINAVVEALEDGFDLADDSGPLFANVSAIAMRLRGQPRVEILTTLAKAVAANVLDELAERAAEPPPEP